MFMGGFPGPVSNLSYCWTDNHVWIRCVYDESMLKLSCHLCCLAQKIKINCAIWSCSNSDHLADWCAFGVSLFREYLLNFLIGQKRFVRMSCGEFGARDVYFLIVILTKENGLDLFEVVCYFSWDNLWRIGGEVSMFCKGQREENFDWFWGLDGDHIRRQFRFRSQNFNFCVSNALNSNCSSFLVFL